MIIIIVNFDLKKKLLLFCFALLNWPSLKGDDFFNPTLFWPPGYSSRYNFQTAILPVASLWVAGSNGSLCTYRRTHTTTNRHQTTHQPPPSAPAPLPPPPIPTPLPHHQQWVRWLVPLIKRGWTRVYLTGLVNGSETAKRSVKEKRKQTVFITPGTHDNQSRC